jgi:hypothetical protein
MIARKITYFGSSDPSIALSYSSGESEEIAEVVKD